MNPHQLSCALHSAKKIYVLAYRYILRKSTYGIKGVGLYEHCVTESAAYSQPS
jgi:hypothetical protein